VALIENIQREDLNAIEEAEGYARLIKEFGHTQEVLGHIVHKSRSHVANLMRLLDLPESVRQMVADKSIEMGHARALIGAPDAEKLARLIADKGLSVREANGRDPDIQALERHLGDVLGLNVRIAHGAKGGSLTLAYSTLDQLDMLCQRLSGERI
jgi:ParB family chromosome partitioning protein